MIKQLILLMLFGFIGIHSYAQLPEKAEDVSPLLIGEVLPDNKLRNSEGIEESVLNVLSEKPTVMLFYRGGWCPYCNKHLAEFQDVENEIIELGYQIIAISPDSPENLRKTNEKQKLNYSLYSDSTGSLSKSMGIAFKVPESKWERLSEKSNGLNDGFLPVPSVFVVDTSGEILFEYINPNYKTRLTSSLLIAILENLKDPK